MSAKPTPRTRENRRGDSTRRRLLDAAFHVAHERGSRALTLEAVADAAGTSKGGLLYHFPTKDALLSAMIEDTLERFHGLITEYGASAANRPGDAAEAYVRASMNEGDAGMKRWSALLAGFFADPALTQGWQERAMKWARTDAEDGGDPTNALAARLAADGLWIRELLGISAVNEEQRRALERRLVELTREQS